MKKEKVQKVINVTVDQAPVTDPPPKQARLWLSHKWYVPVDEKGRCSGPCAEGALGFVIQLRSDDESKHHMALKIPRLMGETHRENAYINELTEKELSAVSDVFLGGGNPAGLLTAEVGHGSLIRGPIATDRGPTKEAQQWHNSIVLVRYEKGQNPFFCLVKESEGEIVHFPPDADCPIVNVQQLSELKEKSTDNGTGKPWARTVFVDAREVGTKGFKHSNIFPVDDALRADPVRLVWYTGLPSIMYGWAPGTLQESISLRLRGENWDINKHLLLIERMCRGVEVLHRKGMLHADVRPANIVYQGDPDDPNRYSLSDYGSFAETGARAADRYPEGTTVLGPILSGERISAFYAPERRIGREREAADTAVIIDPGSTFYYIVLGWRSELIDPQTSRPRTDKIREYIDNDFLNEVEKSSASSLDEGDRIQIREYIFDVIKEWIVADKQILKCNKKFWKVYHGRIVVESEDRFRSTDWFPIPRTVELLQWSASTDLYSLGALALYSVYRDYSTNSQQKEPQPGMFDNNVGAQAAEEDHLHRENSSQVEEDFRVMLNYLASAPYFRVIWPELEWLRIELEKNLEKQDLTPKEFAEVPIERHEKYKGQQDADEKGTSTLSEATIELVQRITQTAPGTRRLVEAFDYDLGRFIFFIHFVFCCLHRQSDVINWEEWMDREEGPFCIDRRERPTRNGAAAKALKRLVYIREKLIGDRQLAELKSDSEIIAEFDPRPDPAVRIQLQALQKAVDEALKEEENAIWRRFTPHKKMERMRNTLERARADSKNRAERYSTRRSEPIPDEDLSILHD